MSQELLSYIVTGGFVIGGVVPLVALLIHSIRENKKLDEVARKKARKPAA